MNIRPHMWESKLLRFPLYSAETLILSVNDMLESYLLWTKFYPCIYETKIPYNISFPFLCLTWNHHSLSLKPALGNLFLYIKETTDSLFIYTMKFPQFTMVLFQLFRTKKSDWVWSNKLKKSRCLHSAHMQPIYLCACYDLSQTRKYRFL